MNCIFYLADLYKSFIVFSDSFKLLNVFFGTSIIFTVLNASFGLIFYVKTLVFKRVNV